MSSKEKDLEALHEAVILASDPKPGWRSVGFICFSIWGKEGTQEQMLDIVASPPEELIQFLRFVQTDPGMRRMSGLDH